jgi:tRNA A-37 threonylcarbamoyl transferase component Bud32/streptogramin lyase
MVQRREEYMSASADPRIGSDFLGYRIEALLGRGGMSVVYRARHAALDRNAALKLLAPELADDARFRERFLRESKLAASLDHPSIVPVYDAGEVEGQLYIAMRYVEGSDLKHLLREDGALEPKRALMLLGQLADALDFAHARGLVHRDVKPSNALLDMREHAYLADFGLTKSASDRSAVTVTGRIMGTVDYAAPEQIEGKPVGGSADVYSLGCLLYECLTGDVPFPRESELAVLWAHVHEPPPKLPAYPILEPVIAKALAKEPKKRYATCRDLVDTARDELGLQDVVVVHDRRPLLLALVGGLLVVGALATGLVLAFAGGGHTPRADLTVRGNTVVRINAATGKVTGVSRVGQGPESVAVGDGIVFVHNWTDGTVSKLDLRTGAVRGTVGLAGSAPLVPAQTIAADAGGAWVVESTADGGLLTHIRPGHLLPQTVPLADSPVTLAIGAKALWVALKTVRGSAIAELDPSDGSLQRIVRLPFPDVQSIAVGRDALWIANQGLGRVMLVRVDPSSGRITGRTTLRTNGGTVAGIALGFGAVWLAQSQPSALLRIDSGTLRVTKRILPPSVPRASSASIGGGIPNLVAEGGAVWWNGTDTGSIWRVDPRAAKVVRTIHIGKPIAQQHPASAFSMYEPLGLAVGGDSVWVTMSLPF